MENVAIMETTNTDSISYFLKELQKYPLLSKEEEQTLAYKAREGDKEAFNKLVNSNLRLVFSIAKKSYNSTTNHSISLEDLIQEGTFGLMRAIESFEPERNLKFSTYATWWIRQAIIRAFHNSSRTVRLPVHIHERIGKIKKIMKENPRITDEELSLRLHSEVKTIKSIKNVIAEEYRLDEVVSNEDGEEKSYLDILSDRSPSSDLQGVVEQKDLAKAIETVLMTLSPKEEVIIRKRFGIGYERTYTLEEIAQEYGVTRERIRQIQAKSMEKLQKNSILKKLEPFR